MTLTTITPATGRNPFGLPDAELLDVLGPSWNAMGEAERNRRGPPPAALPVDPPVATVAELAELVRLAERFPQMVHGRGLASAARTFGYAPRLVLLAGLVDDFDIWQDDGPTRVTLDDVTERRILAFAETVGYGLGAAQATTGAARFATFLLDDAGVDDDAAWRFLTVWNTYNAPPLSETALANCVAPVAQRHAGAA